MKIKNDDFMPNETATVIHEAPVVDIEVSPENVRLSDPMRDLDELAASIAKHGLLQPVVLMGEWGKPPYELISGQRRLLAHKKILKAATIKAIFVPKLNKTQATVRSLIENMQRVELEYEDTANAVTFLYRKFGRDEMRVQSETGLSLKRIRDLILVQERASEKMKLWMKAGKISAVDVKRVIRASQDNMTKAEKMAALIIEKKPTSHQKRRIVTYGENDAKATADDILSRAMKPHVEQNVVVALPENIRKALQKATSTMSIEPEELAAKVIAEWLQQQGFIEE